MKNKNFDYKYFDKFILRTPSLPYQAINDFINKSDVSNEYLKAFFKKNEIKEAIFLASPTLYNELIKYTNNEIVDKKYINDLKISLAKYILRMSTRCTPFGLFAGFSLGDFGETTSIRLNKINKHQSHTRFDMNYLVALSQDLLKDPIIRNKIKFYPNTSIHKIGDKFRYVEYKYFKTERIHNIVSVDFSEYLDKVLNKVSVGSTIKSLSQLITDEEISYEVAENFINELIDSQLLVSEIEPAVTGQEYIHQLLDILKELEGIDPILNTLKTTLDNLKNIDELKLGESVDQYIPISEILKTLNTEFKLNYLFQVDLLKTTISNTLDSDIPDQILEGVDFLSKLTFEASETNMTRFIERFENKYAEKEVCILEALDPEFGIGFIRTNGGEDNSPLLEKIPLGYAQGTNDKIFWNNHINYLDNKILQAVSNKSDKIELTDDEVKDFDSKLNKLSPTFSVVCKILNQDNKGKKQIYIASAGGSSAANLIGRFCHANEETNKFVKSIKKKEEDILNNNIVAEIVHLPQARVGNVLLHPQFHDYEIPYLCGSSSDIEHKIQLSDIMISLYNNKLLMRSKRINKRIIPRLSNAHNYSSNAQPIYQFLCEMQSQDNLLGVGLPLGNALDRYKHIPRIVYKNLILYLAEWKIERNEIKKIIEIEEGSVLLEKVKEWRESRDIPSLILYKEGDNTLFVNLENVFSIKVFFAAIKGSEFIISEFIFDPDNAIVESEEGSFTNEFIISYYKTSLEEDK